MVFPTCCLFTATGPVEHFVQTFRTSLVVEPNAEHTGTTLECGMYAKHVSTAKTLKIRC